MDEAKNPEYRLMIRASAGKVASQVAKENNIELTFGGEFRYGAVPDIEQSGLRAVWVHFESREEKEQFKRGFMEWMIQHRESLTPDGEVN